MAKDSDKLIAEQAKKIKALKDAARKKAEEASSELEDQVDWSQKLLDIETERVKGWKTLAESQDLSAAYMKDLRDKSKQMTSEERKNLITSVKQEKNLQKRLKNQIKIYDIEKEALPHRKKLVEAQTKLNKLEGKYKDEVEKSFEFIGDIDDKIKEIPIVGGFLSKAIGLDKIKEELTDKFSNQLAGALDKSSAKQKKAAEDALKGYDSQIDKLNGVEEAAGEVTSSVSDLGPVASKGASGIEMLTGGLKSSIGAARGLMASLGPILPIVIAIAAAAALIEKALEIDKEVSELARGMGMTKHEALEVHEQLADVVADTDVIGLNLETATQAYKDLNAILGTNASISKEMLESQTLLTKQYGLSGEEAAAFQSTSAGTGKTVEQNLATVEAMVEGYNTMTGDSINFKEISKDIAKTSKATLASYKGDVKALTLAAVQAKKMGMSLEDTQAAADKLLDIESSIENEMKANVLTGKHMNMNMARQLALQGDTAGAAAEAVKQAGDYDELMSMAPYQQKAVAEAAGLTVDQLVKAAELQKYSQALNGAEVKDMKDLTTEQINQLKAAGAINKEKAEQMIKENQIAASNEKMAQIGDKLSAMFAKIAGPIMEILDPIMELVDFLMPALIATFKFLMAPVLGVVDAVSGIAKLFKGDIMGGLKDIGAGIIEFFFSPFKFVFDLITGFFPGIKTMLNNALGWITDKIKGLLPDWAIDLLGLNEDKSKEAEGKKKEVHDAVIDPSGGLEVSGAKGKFKLDKNDTVVAGTDLGSKQSSEDSGILGSLSEGLSSAFDSVSSMFNGGGGNSDNKEIVSLLKELIAKVDQPVKVNINGKVMDEIEKQTTLRKTYNTKVDSGYGTFG